MSRNRRTAIAVRSIGVASAAVALALGIAGNAFACTIGEFTPSAGCDQSGHGFISVLDKDISHTPVDITVSTGGQQVGSKTDVIGSDQGVVVNFPVEWQPSTKYTVTVVKSSGAKVGDVDVTTPEKACATPTTTPPTTAPTTTPPTTTPSTTPSSTTSAPAVGDTNAPSPAAGGGQNLAETGGGSNTGLIAGVAAALVAVGGGAVFALRRRNPAARH